MQADF
jgi:hypothetical protein